jgi:hypothetical protein
MCVDPDMSDFEFFARKQQAMYFWAKLLMADGGNLRDIKCSCYLLIYKFVNGEARLRRMREMPQYEFVIHVFNDKHKPIEQIEVDVALKTLGVFTAPLSTPKPKSAPDRLSEQLKYMVDKGEKWCAKLQSSKLTTRDIWFSFFHNQTLHELWHRSSDGSASSSQACLSGLILHVPTNSWRQQEYHYWVEDASMSFPRARPAQHGTRKTF